jgi:hypothetical protein
MIASACLLTFGQVISIAFIWVQVSKVSKDSNEIKTLASLFNAVDSCSDNYQRVNLDLATEDINKITIGEAIYSNQFIITVLIILVAIFEYFTL